MASIFYHSSIDFLCRYIFSRADSQNCYFIHCGNCVLAINQLARQPAYKTIEVYQFTKHGDKTHQVADRKYDERALQVVQF